jgi:hypothetical protein
MRRQETSNITDSDLVCTCRFGKPHKKDCDLVWDGSRNKVKFDKAERNMESYPAITQWLQLKLSMLPGIAAETDYVIKVFGEVILRIDDQNEQIAAGTSSEVDAKYLSEYSRLRAQMKARMEEIAVFYDDNLDDPKIHFFEKLRLKIKRALTQRPGKKLLQQ